MDAAVQAHEDPDGPAGDLSDDGQTFVVGDLEQVEHLAPHVRGVVGLVEVDADRLLRDGSEPAHPWPFVDRHAGVFRGELEHAVPGATDGQADPQ